MHDALVLAIADLPKGSKAPHIVAAIYGDDKLEPESKDVLATLFMGLYRSYTKGGKLRVPNPCQA